MQREEQQVKLLGAMDEEPRTGLRNSNTKTKIHLEFVFQPFNHCSNITLKAYFLVNSNM